MKIEDLKPASYNPRKISTKAQEGLRSSLAKYGDLSGIVYNERTGNLIGGHQRLEQLQALGATFTDGVLSITHRGDKHGFSVRAVDWTEAKEKGANIAANNTAIAGEWTGGLEDLLGEVLADLGDDEFEELGFDDLADILDIDLDGDSEDKEEPDTPPLPEEPLAKDGDIWILGEHRIVCGDAMDKATVEKALDGAIPDMVFTDPPYNVGSLMGSGGQIRKSRKDLADADWDQDFDSDKWANEILPLIMPENGTAYVCASYLTVASYWRWSNENCDRTSSITWCKTDPLPSMHKRHWTWSTEIIAYITRGKHTFNFPKQGHALSYWLAPSPSKNEYHPTQKPIEIPTRAIVHSSNKGDMVFDSFLGSGSTLLACENEGRRCHGVEMNPAYIDIIVQRWEELTGQEARRL